MTCVKKITDDLLFNCDDPPKKGIDGGKAVLINIDDIDRVASVVVGVTISDLILKAGATGYAVEWYKDLASGNSAFAPSAEDIDGYLHNFLTRLANSSAASAERANELKNGRFIMVYETRYKGVDQEDAFKVAGWENGMKLAEMIYNTSENSATPLFTLTTEEGDVERYPYNIFLKVDYETSKAAFDLLFEGARLEQFISLMSFWGGEFDFVNNLWTDKSGNDNDVVLKNASARTGNGADLDYLIAGLLTTDTVEVETGSDTPTIPVNGTLRIGAAQTVYGVTIRRGGVIWAIIPFCEPYMNENLPTYSYDVSGNARHAVCATIAAGNITTQDSYFYLQEHGYSLGAENILGWDTTSWTGSIGSYDAIFDGAVMANPQSADMNIQPTPDGQGCRVHLTNGNNIRLYRLSALTIGKRYRWKMLLDEFYSSGISGGLAISRLGFTAANFYWFVGDGVFDMSGIATNASPEIGNSNNIRDVDVDFYSPTAQLEVIVPALLDGSADAVGNAIEFVPDGSTWLRYACELEAPAALLASDQKGYWSDYINQGFCVNGETYLVEKTEADHFGVGVEQFDEFVSDGTEFCDDNNEVRELILNVAERGFFFDDDTTPHPRSFDEMVNFRNQFLYCSQLKDEIMHVYNPADPGLLPAQLYNAAGFGWKEYQNKNKIYDLVMLKDISYLTDTQKLEFNGLFEKVEELTFGLISYCLDSWTQADYQNVLNEIEARRLRMTRAIFYSDNVTEAETDVVLASGHEIIAHTPTFNTIPLSAYQGFGDTGDNYTEAQLIAFYDELIAYMNGKGYNSSHKILPGSQYDEVTEAVGITKFNGSWRASGSESINRTPLITNGNLGRDGNDWVDAAAVTEAEGVIDDVIALKGWALFYGHTYSFTGSSIANLGLVLDYLAAQIAAGNKVRFVKLEDAWNIVKKIR